MRLSWYRARYIQRPIRGFGWRGWLATAVFFAILIPHLAGYDWQFLVLETIWRVGDWPAVFWLVANAFPINLSLFQPEFSLFAVLGVWIAMGIAPVRFKWWRYGLLFAASIAVSSLRTWVVRHGVLNPIPIPDFPFWVWSSISVILGGVATWAATRSVLVGLSWVAMVPLVALEYPLLLHTPLGHVTIPTDQWFGYFLPMTLIAAFVQLFPSAVALWWAIRLRRTLMARGFCRACGYSSRGIVSGVCPECGEAILVDELEDGPAEVSPAP